MKQKGKTLITFSNPKINIMLILKEEKKNKIRGEIWEYITSFALQRWILFQTPNGQYIKDRSNGTTNTHDNYKLQKNSHIIDRSNTSNNDVYMQWCRE